MSEETTSADAPTPQLFLHARFEISQPAGDGSDAAGDGGDGKSVMNGGTSNHIEQSTKSVVINNQSFDASNCKAAILGLPDGEKPVKPEAGDYSYSGMHDHGALPPPNEGGQFSDIIGFVTAAKKASDAYLTELIEKEKAVAAAAAASTKTTSSGIEVGQQKRKRK